MMSMKLSPVYKVAPPDWMKATDTRAVMCALGAEKGKSLFVGGCVRNLLMKEPVTDIDIATEYLPQDVIKYLQSAGIKALPTGIEHGTITAVLNKRSFEITTLRCDVDTDGRHAKVVFGKDWLKDAQRRDFTINTMLSSIEGDIYDPLNSMCDIESRYVHFVGDPSKRIKEDYLRILRFFRFVGQYGGGIVDSEALNSCRQYAPELLKLSRERITQEISSIVMQKRAGDTLTLMRDNNIFPNLIKNKHSLETFYRVAKMQEYFKCPDYIARIIALSGKNYIHFNRLDEFLIFTRKMKKESKQIFLAISDLKEKESIEDVQIRKLIYLYGKEAFLQAILLKYDFSSTLNNKSTVKRIFFIANSWECPKFPLSGKDMLKAGIPSGVEMGKIIDKTKEWWMDSDFTPSSELCLKFALKYKKQ